MFGWSFRSFFISAIQAFWFVAVAEADRMAILPLPPGRPSSASLTSVWPISSFDEAFRCISRPALATPESQEMTVMPRCIAFFSVGTSASLSLAETAMASTCWAMRELSTWIWPSAVVSVGPV